MSDHSCVQEAPNVFVGRVNELGKIQRFLLRIKNHSAKQFLLNLYAMDGFGKTALLQHVLAKYKEELPVLFLASKEYVTRDGFFEIRSFLSDIVARLYAMAPPGLVSWPAEAQTSKDDIALTQYAVHLIEAASRYPGVVLFLIDDYDQIPVSAQNWLEVNFLRPTIDTKRAGLVITSKKEVDFKGIYLRGVTERRQLSALSEQTLSRAVPNYHSLDPRIDGFPAWTSYLLQHPDVATIRNPDEFARRSSKLLEDFCERYVEDVLFSNLEISLREALLVVSILRRIDVSILHGVLSRVLPEFYGHKSRASFGKLIERFGDLIGWRQDLRGDALREVPATFLQAYVLGQRPEIFLSTHEAAVEVYQYELEEKFREHYLIEFLYHRIAGRQADDASQQELEMLLIEDLRQQLGKLAVANQLSREDLAALFSSITHDPTLGQYLTRDAQGEIESWIFAQADSKKTIDFRPLLTAVS